MAKQLGEQTTRDLMRDVMNAGFIGDYPIGSTVDGLLRLAHLIATENFGADAGSKYCQDYLAALTKDGPGRAH